MRQSLANIAFSLPAVLAASAVTLSAPAQAQQADSIFDDYASYAAFVDEHVMNRKFIPLIQVLGGRDEYTIEQMNGINGQLLGAWPVDFENVAVFNESDLGEGIRQEGRMYWTGQSYAYYYAILHERDGDLMVLNFYLNTSITEIMNRF